MARVIVLGHAGLYAILGAVVLTPFVFDIVGLVGYKSSRSVSIEQS